MSKDKQDQIDKLNNKILALVHFLATITDGNRFVSELTPFNKTMMYSTILGSLNILTDKTEPGTIYGTRITLDHVVERCEEALKKLDVELSQKDIL